MSAEAVKESVTPGCTSSGGSCCEGPSCGYSMTHEEALAFQAMIEERDRVRHQEYDEVLRRYGEAGLLMRWLIKVRNPRAIEFGEVLSSRASVQDARFAAQTGRSLE